VFKKNISFIKNLKGTYTFFAKELQEEKLQSREEVSQHQPGKKYCTTVKPLSKPQ
jgi:hypothetical protein